MKQETLSKISLVFLAIFFCSFYLWALNTLHSSFSPWSKKYIPISSEIYTHISLPFLIIVIIFTAGVIFAKEKGWHIFLFPLIPFFVVGLIAVLSFPICLTLLSGEAGWFCVFPFSYLNLIGSGAILPYLLSSGLIYYFFKEKNIKRYIIVNVILILIFFSASIYAKQNFSPLSREEAIKTNEIKNCERIRTGWRVATYGPADKYECIIAIAKIKKDDSFCKEITDEEWQRYCYKEMAIDTKNPDLCKKFGNHHSDCIKRIALDLSDKKICEKIEHPIIKQQCFEEIEGVGWRTYFSEEYGFQIKYPLYCGFNERKPSDFHDIIGIVSGDGKRCCEIYIRKTRDNKAVLAETHTFYVSAQDTCDPIKSTFYFPEIGTESYVACGCGCCKGSIDVLTVKCLYHSEGDDIQKIIDDDKKAAQNPLCSQNKVCNRPIKYIYCD